MLPLKHHQAWDTIKYKELSRNKQERAAQHGFCDYIRSCLLECFLLPGWVQVSFWDDWKPVLRVIGHDGILKLYGGEKHSPSTEKSLWATTHNSTKLWLPSQFRAWRNGAITPLLLKMISDKISGKSGFLLCSDLLSFLSWLALQPRTDALTAASTHATRTYTLLMFEHIRHD